MWVVAGLMCAYYACIYPIPHTLTTQSLNGVNIGLNSRNRMLWPTLDEIFNQLKRLKMAHHGEWASKCAWESDYWCKHNRIIHTYMHTCIHTYILACFLTWQGLSATFAECQTVLAVFVLSPQWNWEHLQSSLWRYGEFIYIYIYGCDYGGECDFIGCTWSEPAYGWTMRMHCT